MISNNNVVPLYIQIAENLKDNIRIGKWKEGEKIPSEKELCEIYNVSRITVRNAIEELVKENYLYRERGRGTFVKPAEDNPDAYTVAKGFTDEMKELGKKATTLKAEIEVSRANNRIARILNINEGDKIIILRRIRGDSKKAVGYFVTYFKYDEQYSLNSKDYYGSFYAYLNSLGIKVNKVKEVIEAILPDTEVQKALNISPNEPILKRTKIATCIEKDYYEYTECYYIGSSYKYYLDFM